jgi:hypothetical protein
VRLSLKGMKSIIAGLGMTAVLMAGCASHPRLPETRTFYEVGVNNAVFSDVVTVEFMGDWVLLDGRRLVPKQKIEYIRADREKPEKKP